MPNVYFSERQLQVLSNLCSNWSTSLECASSEFISDTTEFSEIVAEIGEKSSARIGLKEKKAKRKQESDAIIAEGMRIAKRMERDGGRR